MMVVRATLAGFPALIMAWYFVSRAGIEPGGYEGGHIECVAQKFASALDEGLAFPRPRLARHRCQAGKGSDLFFAQCPDFGAFDEDRRGGHLAYSRDRAQDGICPFALRAGTDQVCHFTLKHGELTFDLSKAGFCLAPGEGQGLCLEAVQMAGAICNSLSSC